LGNDAISNVKGLGYRLNNLWEALTL
jgi:hypothetical protein